jgi:hypothetical protein
MEIYPITLAKERKVISMKIKLVIFVITKDL